MFFRKLPFEYLLDCVSDLNKPIQSQNIHHTKTCFLKFKPFKPFQ